MRSRAEMRLSTRGGRQRAVLHSLERFEPVREFGDARGISLYDHKFKAVVVIQVDMLRGYDQLMVVMLGMRQLMCQVSLVVIIDHDDDAGHVAP